MAKGEANKVWLVPSDFGTALQGFTKPLGRLGRRSVSAISLPLADEDPLKPEDDTDEVKDWFTTQTDPAIAQAVAKAGSGGPWHQRTTAGWPPLPPAREFPPLSQQQQQPPAQFIGATSARHGPPQG